MLMPPDGFRYVSGTPKSFARDDLDAPVTRDFCETCGTHLATRSPLVPMVILKDGTLDDPALYGAPQMAIHAADRQPFHILPEGLPAFDRLPPRLTQGPNCRAGHDRVSLPAPRTLRRTGGAASRRPR